MIRVREAIVVEGKYDKIRLAAAVDALIVETDGFGIFKNTEKLALLRLLAAQRGLIILTDSDAAGFVIRDYLGGALPPEQVKHAYCPEIVGKERRKDAPSKEGLLGVEGIRAEVLVGALRRAGATIEEETMPRPGLRLTKARLFADGLTGAPDSAARRAALMRQLGLPQKLSANRLLEVLEATQTEESYTVLLREMEETDGDSRDSGTETGLSGVAAAGR